MNMYSDNKKNPIKNINERVRCVEYFVKHYGVTYFVCKG